MPTRRTLLRHSATVAGLLAGAGLLPRAAQAAWNHAAFEARTVAEALKALGGSAPVESKELSLNAPDIAENGALVPVGASTTLAGVRRLALLVEKNPAPLAAVFELSEAVEPAIATRVKMSQSANVYAVVLMADGRVLYALKDIKVTLGGCGG